MNEPNFSLEELNNQSYRDLQQLAKSLKLPSNVKKIYLIQLIHAKKYQSAEEVDNIVQQVKRERQQQSHVHKFSTRKRKQLQAPDITSTCTITSPSIISTPKRPRYTRVQYSPEVCNKRIKYQAQSLLRSAIKKPKHSLDTIKLSDRVLRSCNQNFYKNLSSENSILKVVTQNSTVTRPVSHTITSLTHDQVYPKVNITKCVVKKREACIQSSYCNLLAKKSLMELMPVDKTFRKSSQTQTPVKRPRILNSSYPTINKEIPNVNYEYVQSIGFRRSDGSISKINALVLKNMKNIQKPPNLEMTMQDLINYNINSQKMNISTSVAGNRLRIEYPDMRSNTAISVSQRSKEVTYSDTRAEYTPMKTQREVMSSAVSKDINYRNTTSKSVSTSNQRDAHLDKPYGATPLSNQREIICSEAQNESTNLNNGNEMPYSNITSESVPSSSQRETHLDTPYRFMPLNNRKQISYSDERNQREIMFSQVRNESTNLNNGNEMPYSNITSESVPSSSQRETHLDTPHKSIPLSNRKQISYSEEQCEPHEVSDQFYHSNYYHKKIRNDRRLSTQRDPVQTLPRINEMFNKFRDDVTQPIYVQVDCERTINYPTFTRTNPNSMSLLENFFNFKNQFLVNQPLLQIATTAKTKCVYTASVVTTAKEQATNVGDGCMPSSCEPARQSCAGMGSPEMNLCGNELNRSGAIESIQIDYACEQLSDNYAEIKMPHMDNINRTKNQNMGRTIDSRAMDYDLCQSPESSSQATVPEMVEDALELISQDGDYLERIGMDVRMQCILCSWAGPRFILEHHIRSCHPDQIIKQEYDEWKITYTLGSLVQQQHWLSQVIEYESVLYIMSAKYEDPEYLLVSLTTLSTDLSTKTGTVTIYNKVTGKPYFWSGEIQILPPSLPYDTDSICLRLEISILDLLPNSANLKLINRELVIKSPSKVIVGNPVLNDIHVILFVKIQ